MKSKIALVLFLTGVVLAGAVILSWQPAIATPVYGYPYPVPGVTPTSVRWELQEAQRYWIYLPQINR